MYEKGEVISIITTVGELVGKLVEQNSEVVVLEKPRMVMHNSEGMGFAAGVCLSGEEGPEKVEFVRDNVVFLQKTNKDVEKAWLTFTSGIQLATTGSIA